MARKLRRWVLYALGALYLATWIWGIPATHTSIARDVISYYKQARRMRPREVWDAHPRLRFGASYAILPFVVVNHYEYQVAGLWGWGGFDVDVWYFGGSVTVFSMCKWIS
jgi:hypothetical protein